MKKTNVRAVQIVCLGLWSAGGSILFGCRRHEPVDRASATSASGADEGAVAADDPVLRPGDDAKPAPPAASLPAVVAKVDGKPITKIELMDAVINRYEVQVHARQTLLYANLLDRCLAKRNLSLTPSEIDGELKAILDKEGKKLEEFLAERRFTEDYLRRQVGYRVGIAKLAFAAGFATDADPKNLSAQANAKADRLLFAEHEVKWRWMGIPDTAWVTIDGDPLPLDEVYRWSVTWLTLRDVKKILNELVAWEFERKAIREQNAEIPKDEYEQLVSGTATVARQAGMTTDQWAAFSGVNPEMNADNTRRALGVRSILRGLATDDRLVSYLETQGPDEGGYGPAVHVLEVAIQAGTSDSPTAEDWAVAKKKIDDVIARLGKGESFKDVASESTDVNLRSRGGDRGWIPVAASSLGEIEAAAAKLEPGQQTTIKSGNAWHVVKVVEKRAGTTPTEYLKNPANRKKAVDDFVRDEKKPWHLRQKRQTKIECFI